MFAPFFLNYRPMMGAIRKNFISHSSHYFSAEKVVTVRGVRNFGAFWTLKNRQNPQSPAK